MTEEFDFISMVQPLDRAFQSKRNQQAHRDGDQLNRKIAPAMN
jgi:hypothetical protein